MMVLISILQGLGPYAWFIVGAVFLIAEVILPGVSLIWFGAAASLTGAALFVFDMGWVQQVLSFIAFACVTVLAGRALAARSDGDGADRVNRGPGALIGRELALVEPIENGIGRALYGDGHWRVAGPDQPAGTKVRVIGIDGATLTVEPSEGLGAR